MTPFFSYYGGKYRYARYYPPPRHGHIIEPFAGAAGYSVRHGAKCEVTLADLDPVVIGVWRYLIRASPTELLRLPDLLPGQSVDELPVCQEAGWLIGFWCRRSSTRPAKSASAWMRTGNYPGSFWGAPVRARLALSVEGIRHWRVVEGTYADMADTEATWFVDPPYSVAGRHYRYGSRRLDYGHLGEWCRARRGQVVVCEQVGAEWLPFRPLYDIATTGAQRSAEAVWVGGEGRHDGLGDAP